MTFTALVNHTFFLLKEHKAKKAEPAQIKADAQLHGSIFREFKSGHSHIVIVKLDTAIEGYRFCKLDRFNFSIL